ncbi:MAG: SCO family protein [SAR324 cluster bacterium]|nr:SCO family protein [SAR324 cluster bacterium]
MFWKKLVFNSLTAHIFVVLLFCFSTEVHGSGKQTNSVPGGDFTLQSVEGPVSLQGLRGKVVILFFGFTNCPDTCPTSLSRMEAAFSKMKKEDLNRVKALFISLDPERDSLEKLKQYVGYFHPNILGVTESSEMLARITKQYGVSFFKKELKNSAMGYVINHTSDIFLIDPQGTLQKTLSHDTSPAILRKNVLGLL